MEHKSDGDTNHYWSAQNGTQKFGKERERAETIATVLLRSARILKRNLRFAVIQT